MWATGLNQKKQRTIYFLDKRQTALQKQTKRRTYIGHGFKINSIRPLRDDTYLQWPSTMTQPSPRLSQLWATQTAPGCGGLAQWPFVHT